MSFSKFTTTTVNKKTRGGVRNTMSFNDKRDVNILKSNIKNTLEIDCKCKDSCMWKLVNKTDDVMEVVEKLRKGRFTGHQHHSSVIKKNSVSFTPGYS